MSNIIRIVVSWVIALWISSEFLNSLFYKFDNAALEPRHIFSTIGDWIKDVINSTLGELFTEYGAIFIGAAELVTALVLLAPIILWKKQKKLHYIGGIMASMLMMGAVFFHIFTPLGWVLTWCNNGVKYTKELACQNAEIFINTSLANIALSILILGIVIALMNKKHN